MTAGFLLMGEKEEREEGGKGKDRLKNPFPPFSPY